jgi:glycosyltransferase involved in cell wall biosynthesis
LPLTGRTILQVIPHLSAGGAERTTIEVAEALTTAGAKALVASVGGRLEGELTRAGGELIRIDNLAAKNPIQVYGNATTLSKIISRHKVDLVHARSRAPAWSAYWAAQRMKKPFVTTYHGVYNAKSSLKRWYNSIMARGEVVIANSDYTAAHVRKEHPEATDRLVTIHRGVDIAKFSPDAVAPARKAALAKAWRLPDNPPPLILLPARMTGWKGHREAIAAAALLFARNDQPWRMIFAGDDQGRSNYLHELSQLIQQHGLDDRIAMVGHCDDMPAAFALADIVIAPSNEPEAFGRVAAEAGAMAVPVIGSDVGGQTEIIANDETGFVVPPMNPPALAEAMANLLDRGPQGRKAMGEAGMARIRQNFTTATLQQATLAVYERLMGRPS